MSESNESLPPQGQAPTNSDEGSARERLARALAAEMPETAAGEAGESQPNAEPQEGGKPKALKELAERLKLEEADVYDVEVPMPNGKAVKLGALKDAHAKHDDIVVRELAFEERVAKKEAEWTRAQTEWQELLSHVDEKAIKPELKEKVRQKIDADMARERKLVLDVIPEWKDSTVREAELAAMVEHLKDFGIHQSFLTSNVNHKLWKMIRSATLQKQRIEKALAQVELVRKPSTTGKSPAGNGAAKKLDIQPPKSGRVTARDRLQKALNS